MLNAALTTIEATLPRLTSLGATIRQVSRGRIEIKAQKFASDVRPDLRSFTDASQAIIQALYPNAHQTLRRNLAKTMTDRYTTIVYAIHRARKRQTRRPAAPAISLPPIDESAAITPQTTQPDNSTAAILLDFPVSAPQRQIYDVVSHSDLSTIDSKHPKWKAIQGSDFLEGRSEQGRRGTSSVHFSQGIYPPLPSQKDANPSLCDWCGAAIEKKMSEDDWR